ncbi:hypothetical protein BTVI_01760 [Pitangus sulphuratus]|nr:hypothetical protein BTVI_01760 [Pitangus sulphuratus]
MFAARHFWNACLPLLGSPHDREHLKEPTEIILKSIIKAESKNKEEEKAMWPLHQWITKDFQSIGSSVECSLPGMFFLFFDLKQGDELQSVEYLMEFAEWLYCNQFPLNDAIKPLHWAVDLLLRMKFPMQSSQEEEKMAGPEFLPTENIKMNSGANDTVPQINLEDLSNIKQLEALFRAQTLLAVISGPGSPCHQQHCLLACACIVRIWQVSLPASGLIRKASSWSSQPTGPEKLQSKSPTKKEKGKKKQVRPTFL